MNYIYVSRNVFNFVKEVVNLRSPSILLLKYSPSDNIPTTPFKVVPFDKLSAFTDLRDYSIIILNPEYICHTSPLFESKFSKTLDTLKKLKPKNVSVVSSLLNYKSSKGLLKQIGVKDQSFSFCFDLDFKIKTVFTEKKDSEIVSFACNENTLIVCKNSEQLRFISNLLSKKITNVLVWDKKEFEYKRRMLNLYKSGNFNLIVPKAFLKHNFGIEVKRIIYVSPPYSIPEYLRGVLSYYTPNLETFILISEKDESRFLKKIRRDVNFAKEYVEFLNFCGFRGNKLEYLKSYLFSTKVKSSSVGVISSETEDEDMLDTLKGSYLSLDEVFNIFLGLNDGYCFYRGFGTKRGVDVYSLKEKVNKLVNSGILGFKYFYDGESLVKKVY